MKSYILLFCNSYVFLYFLVDGKCLVFSFEFVCSGPLHLVYHPQRGTVFPNPKKCLITQLKTTISMLLD